MTVWFAICAFLFLILALAIVLRPLLKARHATSVAREQANLAIYRDQFNELENDLRSGSLGSEQYEKARAELERRMLEDSGAEIETAAPVRRNHAMPIGLALVIPLVAVLLYLQIGNLEGLTAERHLAAEMSSITPEQFQDMTEKLAARMQSNPDDAEGWMMLGRAYRALERLPESAEAFRRAAELTPEDAGALTDYAEALAFASERSLAGEPTRLLARALKIDPDNEKALALSGSAAFERKDYSGAVKHWQRLLRQPGLPEEMTQALGTAIAEAQSLAGGGRSAMAPAAAAASRVSGTVSLDATLAGQAAPDDTVFVFARATQGPRMPLAIVQVKVRDLPYRFSLDDSMAMTPELKISGFPEIVVAARISKSGNATPAAGDLEGVSAAVRPGTGDIGVAIDRVVK